MSVLAFDFYSEDDPNGTPLGTLDDADCKSMEFRPALHELGSGIFTVSRHHTDATSTLIREDNLVKVRVPSVSTDPIFAFWLKEGDFTLIDTNEQGGEDLTFGGPSLLHILSQARLYHSSMVSDQPNRGSINVPGMWTWVNEPYGAILTRLIEEGRESPFPSAAANGSALEHVTITFDRVNDSDGNPWPDITETFQTPIGSDMLSVAERLSAAGDLYLVMDPDLTLHAYQSYGRDLSGSFGSGTVRFEKGVNILTQLVRKIEARQMITHLLQQDKDGAYSTEVVPGYTSSQRKHWGYFEASQTNDDTQLNKIAQNVIAASRTSGQIVELEFTPGFVPASGRYMPGPEGTSGHFWLGDTVTLHTGAGQHDYNAVDQTVIAFRVVLDEASVDTTDDTAARSLHIVPELNHQHIRGFANELGNPGFCCGPNAPVPPDAAACTRWYFTNTSTTSSTVDAAWEQFNTGARTMTRAAVPATVSAQRTLDVTNAAVGQYMIAQQKITLNAAEAAAIAAGGTFSLQARTRARYGTGISEAAQQNFLTLGMRIERAGVILGTPITVGAAASGTRMPPQATLVNRTVAGSFSSVAAVAGDVAILEIGYQHNGPTTGGTGGAFMSMMGAASDLPTDEVTTTDLNSWFQFCSGGSSSGTAPLTTVRQGTGSMGTSNVYVPADSTVEMGLLSEDGLHYLNASDSEYDPTESGVEVTDVQQALDLAFASIASSADSIGAVADYGQAPFTLVGDQMSSWWTTPKAVELEYADVRYLLTSGVAASGAIQQQTIRLADRNTTTFALGTHEQDDHNAGAIVAPLGMARIVFYARHGEDALLRWRIGASADPTSALGSEQTLTVTGDAVTYAQAHHRPGTDEVYVFTRVTVTASRYWTMVWSGDYLATAPSQQRVFDFGASQQGYLVSTQTTDDPDILRLALTGNPNSSSSTIHDIYVCLVNLDSGDITELDGTVLGNFKTGASLPLTVTSALEKAVDVDTAGGDSARLYDVGDGDVFEIAYATGTESTTTDWVNRHTSYNGAAWTDTEIGATGEVMGYTTASHYHGGMMFPDNTPGHEVVLSREDGGEWLVERWYRGDTWGKAQTLASATDVMLVRPFPVVGGQLVHQLWHAVDTYPDFETWTGAELRGIRDGDLSSSSSALDDLSDTQTSGQLAGAILAFDGSLWRPALSPEPLLLEDDSLAVLEDGHVAMSEPEYL